MSYVHARLINQVNSESKEDFDGKSCVILVSVGQPAHEGDKLKATIESVDKTFGSCAVAVCDSLQRHSLRLGTDDSLEMSTQLSNRLGVEWIERNRNILDLLTIPHEIFRWDEYLLREDFPAHKQKVNELYQNDMEFRASMEYTVNEFLTRFQKRQKIPLDEAMIRQASFDYLLEECAIIMLMWQEKAYNYIVYPSDILAVMYQAYRKLVLTNSSDLLKWIRIKLKTKKIATQNKNLLVEV